MDGHRFIKSIRPQGILSFGPEAEDIELQPLNVLIGPNGVGKSNFIDVLSILRALPTDVAQPFRKGGGIRSWIWNGPRSTPAQLRTEFALQTGVPVELVHWLSFECTGDRFDLVTNILRTKKSESESREHPWFKIELQRGAAKLEARDGPDCDRVTYETTDLDPNASLLSQQGVVVSWVLGEASEPIVKFLGTALRRLGEDCQDIKMYRDWGFGSLAVARRAQFADLPNDFLDETTENLALVLNNLWLDAAIRQEILGLLARFNPEIRDLAFNIISGSVQLIIHEGDDRRTIPASRVSDGTIRFLCLVSILCHPKPPPLICLEEPELGLHPDALHLVAELLINASKRTQLIVTTHSDILVSALGEIPDCVLVCERDFDGSTQLRRLDAAKLKKWLDDYSLGELWTMGEIGGNP